MSFSNHHWSHPFVAASAMGQGIAVFMNTASSRDEVVLPAGTVDRESIGLTIASVGAAGLEVAVLFEGIGKARAAASLGAGANVAPASTNGALGPIHASGLLASTGASAGMFPARFCVGVALTAAGAGEYFAVKVQPRQIV